MNIAIIPARGGSKRIPQKNIKPFCGIPIIERVIQTARQSGIFDRIIVSTDCDNIAEIAQKAGAEVPFRRPAELADDYTPTRAVINHAINWLASNNVHPAYICCLYATAPLVSAETLRNGLRQLQRENANFCFTVTAYPYPIQRALAIDTDKKIYMIQPEHRLTRSQDLTEAYHDAGQFYWGVTSAFIDNLIMYSDHATPLILPRWQVQDIDTEDDWIFAEQLFTRLRKTD